MYQFVCRKSEEKRNQTRIKKDKNKKIAIATAGVATGSCSRNNWSARC